MKLNFKIYSPFLILFTLVVISCNNKRDNNFSKGGTNVYNPALYNAQYELKKAHNYYNTKAYDSAFNLFMKVREIYIAQKDNSRAGYSSYMMAEIQMICGDYTGSENTAVEALNYLKKTSKPDNLNSVYNLLGICYKKKLDYDDAISNYKEAINYTTDSLKINIILNNIASIYIEKKNYEQAITLLLKLNKSALIVKDSITKARVIDNLGAAYFKSGKPHAIQYLKKALEIRQRIGKPKDMLSSYLNFSDFYAKTNKALSGKYAIQAYKTASDMHNTEEKLKALKNLIVATPGTNGYKYTIDYINLNDSLNNVKSRVENKFAKLKYDSKTTQAQNLRLKNQQTQIQLQSEKDKVLKIVFLMMACCVFVIAIFIFIVQRLRHKKSKIIEVYNTESRISKKIHDELANDMFDTMMFTESLRFDTVDKKEILLKRLDSVYEKTRDISRENSSVDTGNDFYVILIEMLARYKTPQLNVLPVNADSVTWEVLDEHKKITIYRVLQEFMVNMKKHSEATLVVLKFNVDDKKLHINYVDNGLGIKKNNFFYKNGLQNAENRIKSINGTITFDGETKGLKISIAIPI